VAQPSRRSRTSRLVDPAARPVDRCREDSFDRDRHLPTDPHVRVGRSSGSDVRTARAEGAPAEDMGTVVTGSPSGAGTCSYPAADLRAEHNDLTSS
jgi:hypothetical protein